MELRSAKAHHIHVVPIFVLSIGLFLFSVFGIGSYMSSKPGSTDNRFYNIVNARLFTVHATAIGLPTITLYGSSSRTSVRNSPGKPESGLGDGLNQVSTTGEVTVLDTEITSQLTH